MQEKNPKTLHFDHTDARSDQTPHFRMNLLVTCRFRINVKNNLPISLFTVAMDISKKKHVCVSSYNVVAHCFELLLLYPDAASLLYEDERRTQLCNAMPERRAKKRRKTNKNRWQLNQFRYLTQNL